MRARAQGTVPGPSVVHRNVAGWGETLPRPPARVSLARAAPIYLSFDVVTAAGGVTTGTSITKIRTEPAGIALLYDLFP